MPEPQAGFPNATPMAYLTGIKDESIGRLQYEVPRRAIHLPIIFNWAEYGPTDTLLVHGNTIPLTYGEETVNMRSKWATHVSPYMMLFLSNANPVMFKRLLPRDIGPKASLRISVEVLEEEIDEFEREVDGYFKRDVNDDLIPTGRTITGHILKFHKQVIDHDPVKGSNFAKGAIKTGTLQNKKGEFSKIYPLLDFVAPHYGSKGNNYGIRISAPTTKDTIPLRENILHDDNCYPFRLTMVHRKNEKTSSKEIPNNYGERTNEFVIKPDLIDTKYNVERFLGHVVLENYQDLNPYPGFPIKYGPFGQVSVYHDNFERVLKAIMTEEAKYNYIQNDLYGLDPNTEEELFYRVNIFNLTNSDGSPYQSARFDDSSNDGIRFTELTDHFMLGASDGTMTDSELATLVEYELEEFGDINSEYQDLISYPCSAFWDSGFPLSTKYKMGYFISQRKNTNVYVSTYVSGERPLTMEEEISRGIAIVERLRIFAESDYWATPTVRASLANCSCKIIDSTWKKRVPVNYNLADMVSKMAAGEAFRKEYVFDRPPYNVFSLTSDVSILWAPVSVRYRQWNLGMMWPEKLEQRKVFFPASRTIYKEDTSVLTSLITAIVMAEVETVGWLCHRYFTGRLAGKNDLIAGVEEFCHDNLKDRFAELYRIEPICYFTDADNARHYSWTLKIKVYCPMMRTVETLIVEAWNIDDIPADSPAFKS